MVAELKMEPKSIKILWIDKIITYFDSVYKLINDIDI